MSFPVTSYLFLLGRAMYKGPHFFYVTLFAHTDRTRPPNVPAHVECWEVKAFLLASCSSFKEQRWCSLTASNNE